MTRGYDFRRAPGHLVRRAHQRSVAIFAEEMARFDVTPVQFAILMTREGGQAGAEMALAAPRIQERLVAPLAPEERAQLSLLLSKLEEGSP